MGKSLETNKLFAAILIALLVALVATLIAGGLVKPKPLEHAVYLVEGEPAGSQVSSPQLERVAEEDIEDLVGRGDVMAGKEVARKCLQCHSLDKKGPHRIGPRLWGIVGSPHARFSDFPYSQAAQNKKGVWDVKTLNQFLKNPRDYLPGTKMAFAGIKKVVDRANLIAYLKKLEG